MEANSPAAKPIVAVENLTKTYQTNQGERLEVLRDASLEVAPTEIVAITGESGSGKSTLLHVLGALDRFDSGKVSVCGYDLSSVTGTSLDRFRNVNLGFVFQFHYLLPDFNALENVAIPFLARSYQRKQALAEAERLLHLVGLKDRLSHFPSQLSGGEQQRVAIARALINRPALVLADEPTGNLDKANSALVQELLWRLRDELSLTLLIVTHNVEMASLTDRHFRLQQGNLAQVS